MTPSHSVSRCAKTSLLAKKISVLRGGTKLERNRMTMKTKRWMNDEQIWTVLLNGIKIKFLWQKWTWVLYFFSDSSLWCQGQERRSWDELLRWRGGGSQREQRGTLVSDGKAEMKHILAHIMTNHMLVFHYLILLLASPCWGWNGLPYEHKDSENRRNQREWGGKVKVRQKVKEFC